MWLSKLLFRHELLQESKPRAREHERWLRASASRSRSRSALDESYDSVLAAKARRDRLDQAIAKLGRCRLAPVCRDGGAGSMCLRGVSTLWLRLRSRLRLYALSSRPGSVGATEMRLSDTNASRLPRDQPLSRSGTRFSGRTRGWLASLMLNRGTTGRTDIGERKERGQTFARSDSPSPTRRVTRP
jgi:hypothetical protein